MLYRDTARHIIPVLFREGRCPHSGMIFTERSAASVVPEEHRHSQRTEVGGYDIIVLRIMIDKEM